jgi:hypothetical protein
MRRAVASIATIVLGLGAVTAAPVRAQVDAPVRPGVRYESPGTDRQQVGFFAIPGSDELVFSISVRCKGHLRGTGRFPAHLDAKGRLTAEGPVSSKDGDDTFTDGSAKVTGRVDADGGASGHVDFDLEEYDQMTTSDVRGRCSRRRAPWDSGPGTADPGLARIQGATPLPDGVTGEYAGSVVAADGSVYASLAKHPVAPPFRLVRVDPTSGRVMWSTRLVDEPATLVAGTGAIWAAINGSIDRFDAATGKLTGQTPGTLVAVGSDGSVWAATADTSEVRRLDTTTGTVVAKIAVDGGDIVGDGMAAGPSGIYFTLRNDAPIGVSRTDELVRFDPATGIVAARVEADEGKLAVDGSTLWSVLVSGVALFDPVTLTKVAENGDVYDPGGIGLAAPGLWMADYSELDAVDRTGHLALTIPWVRGQTASDTEVVYLLTREYGLFHLSGA